MADPTAHDVGVDSKTIAEHDRSATVAFLAGVRTILRKLPVQTFVDNDARNIILQAAQEALDEAIADEEQAMEQRP